MFEITRITIVESKQAIWYYDPLMEENRAVSDGGLDTIAALRTLAVKVQ